MPFSAWLSTGTPSTGSAVIDAAMPGRCAAPPAPAMITLRPRSLRRMGIIVEPLGRAVGRNDLAFRGRRRARRAFRRHGASSPSRSLLPMMMPTSGSRHSSRLEAVAGSAARLGCGCRLGNRAARSSQGMRQSAFSGLGIRAMPIVRGTGNRGTMSDQLTDVPDAERLIDEIARLRGAGRAACRQRVEQLDQLAHQDPLIDLPNRRGFMRELERLIDRASRYGEHGGDAVRRPRRAEDDQRQLRPQGRRRGADPGRRAAGRRRAPERRAWRGSAATSSASCSTMPTRRARTKPRRG